MPEPKVTIATVHDAHTGLRRGIPGKPDGYYRRIALDWPEDAPLPRHGDRVAVAGSVDAIFGWMDSLPAARVIAAARAWAKSVEAGDGRDAGLAGAYMARSALLAAVEALGEAPSEAYDPGQEAGDRGATVITIIIGEGA